MWIFNHKICTYPTHNIIWPNIAGPTHIKPMLGMLCEWERFSSQVGLLGLYSHSCYIVCEYPRPHLKHNNGEISIVDFNDTVVNYYFGFSYFRGQFRWVFDGSGESSTAGRELVADAKASGKNATLKPAWRHFFAPLVHAQCTVLE